MSAIDAILGELTSLRGDASPEPTPEAAPVKPQKVKTQKVKASVPPLQPSVEEPKQGYIDHNDRYDGLFFPREPDFVDGYKLKLPNGSHVSLQEVWEAYMAGENILLQGPSGSGKSTIVFHLIDKANHNIREKNQEILRKNLDLISRGKDPVCKYLRIPYEVAHFSCHEATRSESLIGSLTLKVNKDGSREPIVVYGAVTDAWVNGKTLVLEEMDFAPPGVWGEAHQFFDGRTQETTVYINGPEKIRKSSRFRVLATANTLGAGENQIEYSGTQVLNKAFMNRFSYIVNVGYMERDAECGLVKEKTGLGIEAIEGMVDAATRCREAHAAGTFDAVITTRDILSWARECVRAEKRMLTIPKDRHQYWQKVVLPSAGPTFMTRIADSGTLDVMSTYLQLR